MASAASVKKSLLEQLKEKGADTDFFIGLVEDYFWYDTQERAMHKDIKERGLNIKVIGSSGIPVQKENPSVKNAINYNKQKLAIIKQLGLTVDNVDVGDDDDL